MSRSNIHLSLANSLLESAQCASLEEAVAVVDAIVEEFLEKHPNENEETFRKFCIAALQDYLGLAQDEASKLVPECNNDSSSSSASNNENDKEDDESERSQDDDEDEWIGEGECELCERVLQRTKHHLIPKSTWARIQPRLLHAAAAIEKRDLDRANVILGEELKHFMSALNDTTSSTSRSSIRQFLQRTCHICRPCHSAIHTGLTTI